MARSQVGFGFRGGGRKGMASRMSKPASVVRTKKPKPLSFKFKKL